MAPTEGPGSECDDESIRRAKQLYKRRLIGGAVFLAGPANVVCQLGWPEVGYGVVESTVYSGMASRHPFKRFRTTIGFLGIAMLGSDELRAAYAEAVNAQHRQVFSGSDSPVKYNAFDPNLQLWVATCLFYGLRDVITRMHGPMTDEEEDLLLALGGRCGTTLQVPQGIWHRDMPAFRAYWEQALANCRIDEPVREYLLRLLHAQLLPAPLNKILDRPLFWFNAGFLPPELRLQIGIEWNAKDQRRHDRMLRALGRSSRAIPTTVRQFPINAMVANIDIRRRLGLRMV